MCGIAGFIGESKDPQLSFKLITALFEKIEMRGKDAAGFWGSNKDNKILYHKEPGTSSNLIKKEIWKSVCKFNPNLFIAHAREASSGVGPPNINKNNHPFTSADRSIALVHNGRIHDIEYAALKQKYEVLTKCDSEILLRIFEAGAKYAPQDIETEFGDEDLEIGSRLMGIKDIWSTVCHGHMAVAIGEQSVDSKRLWLFRNIFRTLWLVDVREQLGQIFFCSTAEIWQSAVASNPVLKSINKKTVKLLELPPEEVWLLRISDSSPIVEDSQTQRFDVRASGESEPWSFTGEPLKINKPYGPENVITELNSEEEFPIDSIWGKEFDKVGFLIKEIKSLASDVDTIIHNKFNSGDFHPKEASELIDDLESVRFTFESILRSLDN